MLESLISGEHMSSEKMVSICTVYSILCSSRLGAVLLEPLILFIININISRGKLYL